jgi:hypothetical protein
VAPVRNKLCLELKIVNKCVLNILFENHRITYKRDIKCDILVLSVGIESEVMTSLYYVRAIFQYSASVLYVQIMCQ